MSDKELRPIRDEVRNQIHQVLPSIKSAQLDQLTAVFLTHYQTTFNQTNIIQGAQTINVEMLRQIDQIVPGSAKQVMDLFEKQVEHRHKLETVVISAGVAKEKRAQWFTFGTIAIVLLFGGKLIMDGKEGVAYVLFGGMLSLIATTFIVGRIFNFYQLKINKKGIEFKLMANPPKQK